MRRPGQRRVVVVMPARNAARTLQRTVAAIPPDCVDEIILVDDFSTDGTIRVARERPCPRSHSGPPRCTASRR